MFLSSPVSFSLVNATPISAMQPMTVIKEQMAGQLVMESGGNVPAKVSQYSGLQIFKILFMIMLVLVGMAAFGYSHIQATRNTVGNQFQ